MLKKCVILGAVLLLAGGGTVAWNLRQAAQEHQQILSCQAKCAAEPDLLADQCRRWTELTAEQQGKLALDLETHRKGKDPDQLTQGQQERLLADVSRLAAGQGTDNPFAEFLYGPDWKRQVLEYKNGTQRRESLQTGGLVCGSIGLVLLGACGLVLQMRGLVRIARWVRKLLIKDSPPDADEHLDDDAVHQGLSHVTHEEPARLLRSKPAEVRDPEPVHSGPGKERRESEWTGRRIKTKALTAAETGAAAATATAEMTDDIGAATLLATEDWMEPDTQFDSMVTPGSSQEQQEDPTETDLEDAQALSAHAQDLQRQVAEFKEMAQSLQQSTRESSEPLKDTLSELTEQISAIREYAAQQQDRVERLQDGYDWNIMRTFCLRIIRCIDNLESRIARLSRQNGQSKHLTEVRDELLFALESSGIEQFVPEKDTEYRGQEKLAEAVKEKQKCNDPDKCGTIACVIRPGYQYIIDDENVKIVRTAQVKLYG